MKTGWQLCVIDYDRVRGKFKGLDAFLNKCKHNQKIHTIKNGEIVYYMMHRLSTEYSSVDHPSKDFLNIIGFPEDYATQIAEIYFPNNGTYGWCLLFMLWPIVSEKDVIDAKVKFGISLKEYID